jgi:hypothetical protein
LIKPVASVGDAVWLDAEKRTVLDDRILELLLLLGGVRVVESEQKLALVLLVREVVVKQRGLGVANMEVSTCGSQ